MSSPNGLRFANEAFLSHVLWTERPCGRTRDADGTGPARPRAHSRALAAALLWRGQRQVIFQESTAGFSMIPTTTVFLKGTALGNIKGAQK